jgi:hypothetical protein
MPNHVRPIDPNFGERLLRDATVQEIHLELFRRTIAPNVHLDEFICVLLANRNLWRGAVIDNLGVSEGGFWLQPSSMIKLRDIDEDFWNADTLYVLCDGRAAADELAAMLPMERFGCLTRVEDDPRIIRRALGGGREGPVIVSFWWD